MSKHDKFRARLCGRPPPADVRWPELRGFLEHLGFEVLKGSGSRRKFFHREKDVLIILHEPHPQPTVDKVYVVRVVETLKLHHLI